MLFTIILFSLLLVSIIGITSLVIYKMLCVGRDMEIVTASSISVNVFKRKLAYFFDEACRTSTHSVFPKVKNTFNIIKGRISDKHIAFSDKMNGKGNTSKKGAASFFLKNVAEHKKAFHRDGK